MLSRVWDPFLPGRGWRRRWCAVHPRTRGQRLLARSVLV